MRADLIHKIKASAKQLYPDIVNIRRELHQFPELSFQEKHTSERIEAFLTSKGISYTKGWAGYGIVATIHGTQNGSTVMLRADMDALPITEENDVSYKSKHDG